jgi:hypothetical protein
VQWLGLRSGWGTTVTCDRVWTRLRIQDSKVEVLPDGTIPPPVWSGGLLSPGNTSLVTVIRGNWLCSSAPGTHEYVFRAAAYLPLMAFQACTDALSCRRKSSRPLFHRKLK